MFTEDTLSPVHRPRAGASVGNEKYYPCLQVTGNSSPINEEVATKCDVLEEKMTGSPPEEAGGRTLHLEYKTGGHWEQEPLLPGCVGGPALDRLKGKTWAAQEPA